MQYNTIQFVGSFLRSKSAWVLVVLTIFFTLGQGYGSTEWKKVDEQNFWTSWANFATIGSNLSESHPRYSKWVEYFAKYREEVDLLIRRLGFRCEDVSYYTASIVTFNSPDTLSHFYLNFPSMLHDKRTPVAIKLFCEKEVMVHPYDFGSDNGIRMRSLPNGFMYKEYIPDTDRKELLRKSSEASAWSNCVDIPDGAADVMGYGPMKLTANSESDILFEKGYGPIFFIFIPVPGHNPKVVLLRYRVWFF